MRAAYLFAAVLLGALTCTLESAGQNQSKKADDLPQVKDLANPFIFADGSPVRTKEDWSKRRGEIKELFANYMYGHMPPRPAKMSVAKGERVTDEVNKVIVQKLKVTMEQGGKTFEMEVTVALPSEAKEKVPVLVQASFGGGKKGDKQAAPPPPGQPFAQYTKRGYAVAQFVWNTVAADSPKGRSGGMYTLFGDDIDAGALMGWAWGISRVIDALQEAVPEVDITKVFITGHSRYGKATLVAGAFDERIALTVPSHSGTGGLPPYRFVAEFTARHGKTETLQNVATSFPHWFRPDFNQFVGKVDRLPVDQHMLCALVAPRALMNTEGLKDIWINPEGAQVSYTAAKKVYEFLGAGDKISICYRDVGHVPSTPDLLDFADYMFHGKALPSEFGKLPYKGLPSAFSWDRPK
jgi:endo-1,4-beta-xylanase